MSTDPIRHTITIALGLLIDREYEALANMTHGRRLSAADIREAIEEYGRTLVWPPDGLPSDLEIYEAEAVDGRRRVGAEMSLWTKEEGRSDLSLILTLTEHSRGLWGVQIHDIRVM